jgi:hypothetical protein
MRRDFCVTEHCRYAQLRHGISLTSNPCTPPRNLEGGGTSGGNMPWAAIARDGGLFIPKQSVGDSVTDCLRISLNDHWRSITDRWNKKLGFLLGPLSPHFLLPLRANTPGT